jgi:hypothetical protein
MERDVAIRIDGMALGAKANLDGIAWYLKNNTSADEYSRLVKFVGEAMGALCELSQSLYDDFPDIVPKELQPPEPSK